MKDLTVKPLQMKFLPFVLILFLSSPSHPQSMRELVAEGKTAYEAKDYPKFLSIYRKLDSIRPGHPTFTYNLACAHSLNGNLQDASAMIKRAILMNSSVEFENDADLAALKSSAYFDGLLRLKAGQKNPVENSIKATTLSEKDLHPESVIFLPNAEVWLASSIRKGKISSFGIADGITKDWLSFPGMMAVFAMKPDKDEKFLWVATSAVPQWQGYNEALDGKAEILKVDIATKQIVDRFSVAGKHVFGDIAVLNNGDIILSDSVDPKLYKIKDDKLAVWIDLPEAFNLQGIAVDDSGKMLYLADYIKGIAAIDLASKKINWMKMPENATPKGIDGLTFYKKSLVAVHNGVVPIRIARYQLSADGRKIEGFDISDNNRPEFNEPTSGTIYGGSFWFFANAPWAAYDETFNLTDVRFTNPQLYRLSLKP